MKAFAWGLLAGGIMRIVFSVTDANSASLDISRILIWILVAGILFLAIVGLAGLLQANAPEGSPTGSNLTDKGQTS